MLPAVNYLDGYTAHLVSPFRAVPFQPTQVTKPSCQLPVPGSQFSGGPLGQAWVHQGSLEAVFFAQ